MVEDALAGALSEASRAARWDIVAQLAREPEARRLSHAGVTTLVETHRDPCRLNRIGR
jgi:hypothetical protein